ncbi:kinase-like domain-containing protein [Phyllosticta capitalensis]
MARIKLRDLNVNFTNHYTVGKYLGGGADGKVYRVNSKRTGYAYAAKILVPRTDPLQESHIGYLLKYVSHENVVKFGQDWEAMSPGKPEVLLFEYCELGTLADLVLDKYGNYFQTSNHMLERKVRHIFMQLLSALKFLHEPAKGSTHGPIIHRDIKPDNIVVTKNPRDFGLPLIKLCDFGGALEAESTNCGKRKPLRPSHLAAFSRGFAPPELGWPPKASAYSSAKPAYDVYSVGATIYWIIRRTVPPTSGKTIAPRGQASEQYYSKSFWDVLRGALQRTERSRWSRQRLRKQLSKLSKP